MKKEEWARRAPGQTKKIMNLDWEKWEHSTEPKTKPKAKDVQKEEGLTWLNWEEGTKLKILTHYFAIIVSIPKRILLKGNQATKPQHAWS